MKARHASETYWITRLAPYFLVGVLAALGLSFVKAVPPAWCIFVGGASGSLVLCFHALKWRTGSEGYQFAAIAAWMIPFFIWLELGRSSGFQPGLQFVGVSVVAYLGGVLIFRRRIRAWMQT